MNVNKKVEDFSNATYSTTLTHIVKTTNQVSHKPIPQLGGWEPLFMLVIPTVRLKRYILIFSIFCSFFCDLFTLYVLYCLCLCVYL